jgi:hypothetical protein
MSKTKEIRDAFEAALVAGLKGDALTDKDGEPVTTKDGEIVRVAPQAQLLSVVRAYLKDQEDGSAKQPPVPQPGKPTGVLAEYLAKNGSGLPFGPAVHKQ